MKSIFAGVEPETLGLGLSVFTQTSKENSNMEKSLQSSVQSQNCQSVGAKDHALESSRGQS